MKNSFLAKCIAIILFAVTMTTLLLSGTGILFGVYTGAFAESLIEQHENKELMTVNMLWSYEHRINETLDSCVKYKESFDFWYPSLPDGILVEIKNVKDDSILYSTYDKSAGDITVSYERSFSVLKDEYKNEEDIIKEKYEEESTTVHSDDNVNVVDEGETVPSTSKYYDEYTFEITIQYDENSEKNYIGMARKMFDFLAENKTNLIMNVILSFIISLVALIIIMRVAGHTNKSDDVYISRFDKFPVDILITIFGAFNILLFYGLVAFIDWLDYGYQEFNYYAILISLLCLCVAAVFVDFILLAILIMTTAVRCKTSTFIKSTIIYKLIVLIIKILKIVFKIIKNGFIKTTTFLGRMLRKIPLVWKTVIAVAVILLVKFFATVIWDENFYFLLFFISCILCAGVIFVAVLMKDIKNATEDIANGNVYNKIDTKHLFLDLKDHAENINNISDGIQKAVAEQMKSERFKTELITNVSHDIKTPLTSIINYVDLLEKEEIGNETAKEYIDVLSRQSSRLKKLIDDLMEASKVSTGNISVNLMKFELGILLSQALGEYEERFSKNNLQVVLNKTDETLPVMADNRHMWRVFDNVLNNIAKYAQSGTRVYVDAKQNGKFAEISFRNISKDPLNISGDELMERFVRGDSSRNTEGSGLGLSIAKSLTEVQKGNLEIQIDGDLFKVLLRFPLSE